MDVILLITRDLNTIQLTHAQIKSYSNVFADLLLLTSLNFPSLPSLLNSKSQLLDKECHVTESERELKIWLNACAQAKNSQLSLLDLQILVRLSDKYDSELGRRAARWNLRQYFPFQISPHATIQDFNFLFQLFALARTIDDPTQKLILEQLSPILALNTHILLDVARDGLQEWEFWDALDALAAYQQKRQEIAFKIIKEHGKLIEEYCCVFTPNSQNNASTISLVNLEKQAKPAQHSTQSIWNSCLFESLDKSTYTSPETLAFKQEHLQSVPIHNVTPSTDIYTQFIYAFTVNFLKSPDHLDIPSCCQTKVARTWIAMQTKFQTQVSQIL